MSTEWQQQGYQPVTFDKRITPFDQTYGQAAEGYLEEGMYRARLVSVELPLFQYLATASVAFGVQNRYELLLATGAHIVYASTGNQGLAAIYSSLAGIQTAKGKFKTAALATLLDVYDSFKDFMAGRGMTLLGGQKLAWWVVGYTAALFRYV